MKWMALVVGTLVAAGTLVPALAWAYGRIEGPCTISCNNGSGVSCFGGSACYWGVGWVSCDSGPRLSCIAVE